MIHIYSPPLYQLSYQGMNNFSYYFMQCSWEINIGGGVIIYKKLHYLGRYIEFYEVQYEAIMQTKRKF